jgi:uncharacterized membrane protein
MKKHFITGLIILLPLALTIWLFLFIVNLLTKPFIDIVQGYLVQTPLADHIGSAQTIYIMAQGLILLSLVLFTLFLGFLARWVVVHSAIDLGDRIIHRIPLVNTIYRTTKEVVHTVMQPDATAFKQVVMVNFPNPRVSCLGLVTSRNAKEKADDDLITVFVPATPNPTMGYLVIYRRDQVRFINLGVEEALKAIVSCGLVYPESAT